MPFLANKFISNLSHCISAMNAADNLGGYGAAAAGAAAASDARQPQIWEIILPPSYGWFKIKTKNPLRTMQKIFWDNDDVDRVAVRSQKMFNYVYVTREDLEKLLEGEKVRLRVTTGPPFNRWGICEAWSTATFSRDDFEYDQWLLGFARYVTRLFGER